MKNPEMEEKRQEITPKGQHEGPHEELKTFCSTYVFVCLVSLCFPFSDPLASAGPAWEGIRLIENVSVIEPLAIPWIAATWR